MATIASPLSSQPSKQYLVIAVQWMLVIIGAAGVCVGVSKLMGLASTDENVKALTTAATTITITGLYLVFSVLRSEFGHARK